MSKKQLSEAILIQHDQLCDWMRQMDDRLQFADKAKDLPDKLDNEIVIQIISELAEQGRALPVIEKQCKAWLTLDLNAKDERNVLSTQALLKKLKQTHQSLLFLMEYFNPRLVQALFEEAIQGMLGESEELVIEQQEDQLH